MDQMKINAAGLTIIKESEGLRLKSYRCPAGVWTIGYGHTAGVKSGQVCTLEQAEHWLREDVEWAEKAVSDMVTVPLSENQFSALVSWVFNVGASAAKRSTLVKLLNNGEMTGTVVEREFKRWNKGGGKVLPGLVIRRAKEADLFVAPVSPQYRVAPDLESSYEVFRNAIVRSCNTVSVRETALHRAEEALYWARKGTR